jgi:hypothetical protein
MSVTHFRLGASALKSRSSVFAAGIFVGSFLVVVGRKHLRTLLLSQFLGDLSRTVDRVALLEHSANRFTDFLSSLATLARGAIDRVVVARAADAQHLTHQGHRKGVAMLGDPGAPFLEKRHSDSLAKYAVTFLGFHAPVRCA